MSRALEGQILVTGGAGFIGSALVWALNRRGAERIVVSDFLHPAKKRNASEADWNEKRRNLDGLRFRTYVEADELRSRIAASPSAFGEFSAVFHLGACSSTTETDDAYLSDNNFACTRDLAAWALAQRARFIYASSAATYGDGAQGMDDRDDNLARLRPLNLYAVSKQRFDLHAQKERWLDRIAGLKYFNVFGPNEGHKGPMSSVVYKITKGLLAGKGTVQLFKSYRADYKDGEQMRDFLYVKDAIEMTLHFAEKGCSFGGIYNLGSGEAHTWNDLVSCVFVGLAGPNARIEYVDMPAEIRDKYQYYTKADISKLRSTGYDRPLTPLPEAVADYVRNYLRRDKRLGEAE